MYTDWKTKKNYSPKSIRLDAKNPRLHDVPGNSNQGVIANLLLSQYNRDIRSIAKSIVEKGYFPHEDILLIEERKKLVVVEGNCRICACLVLLNPGVAKDPRDKNHFTRLARKLPEPAKNSFKKIPCSIAPSREQAYILIESRHTSAPINPWTPYAQGNFYRSLLIEGRSIQELSEEFNRPASDIRGKIRVTGVSDIIMHLPEASLNPGEYTVDVKKTGEAAAIILRLLQSKEAQKFFGLKIDMNDVGNLLSNVSEEDFLRVLSSLAKDALLNKSTNGKPIIDTRILNDEDGRKAYLAKYSGDMPQGKSGHSFNSETFLGRGKSQSGTTSGDGDSASGTEPKPKTKRPTDQWLINPNVEIIIKNEKVRALVGEAQRLKWSSFPHTAGLLLRAIIECSLKSRMKDLGLWNGVVKANKGNPVVGLSKLIAQTFVHKTVLDDAELYEGFKSDFHTAAGNKRFKLVLDFIQHNDQHRITKEDLGEIRTRTEALIRHLVDTLPAIASNSTSSTDPSVEVETEPA